MAEFIKLSAQKRQKLGTAECRRLRKQGIVPGTVYGHQIDPLSIALRDDDLQQVLRLHGRIVDLDVDGTSEKAMLREMQWDTFGTYIQHVDLLRINPDERVTVEVAIELRGIAAGTTAGGVVEQTLKSVTIDCQAINIPDHITVRIGDLEKGQAITVSELELPEGTRFLNPPDAIVVHVVEVSEEELPEAGEGAAAQPEVLGRKEKEEEGNE